MSVSHLTRQLLAVVAAVLTALASTADARSALRDVEGVITHVTDGDSAWLQPAGGGAPVQLRLLGIDAPESCQAWGIEATRALRELVLQKHVLVKTVGQDGYGRTLGTVYLGDQNVNKTLVQEGQAWSTRSRYDQGPYVADERMAKALGRGLNAAGGAVMPKDFRRNHGPCARDEKEVRMPSEPDALAAPPALQPTFHCDGRTHCSQMHSCAEATFFLNHCPGVKMDGNRDGVPCEKQWCGGAR